MECVEFRCGLETHTHTHTTHKQQDKNAVTRADTTTAAIPISTYAGNSHPQPSTPSAVYISLKNKTAQLEPPLHRTLMQEQHRNKKQNKKRVKEKEEKKERMTR